MGRKPEILQTPCSHNKFVDCKMSCIADIINLKGKIISHFQTKHVFTYKLHYNYITLSSLLVMHTDRETWGQICKTPDENVNYIWQSLIYLKVIIKVAVAKRY